MNLLDTKYQFRKKFARYQTALEALSTPVVIGDKDGNVFVTGREGFIYVTPEVGNMPPMEVFNKRVTPVAGLEVFIGYDPVEPNLLQVISTHSASSNYTATIPPNPIIGGQGTVGPHAWSHGYLMPDQVLIQKRAFLPGSIHATTLVGSQAAVIVYDDIVWAGGQFRYITPQTVDLDAHIPSTAGHSRYVAISVNATGAIALIDGTEIASLAPALTDAPAIPSTNVLLGFVRLYAGMSGVSEHYQGNVLYTDILDPRSMLFRMPVTSAGGDFSGPGSAVAGDFVQFDGITGKLGKDGGYSPASFARDPTVSDGDLIIRHGTAGQGSDMALSSLGSLCTGLDWAGTHTAPLCIDGDDGTWDTIQTYTAGSAYHTIDLLTSKTIWGFRYLIYDPFGGNATINIYSSLDNVAYSPVWLNVPVTSVVGDNVVLLSAFPSPVTGRYFRFQIIGSTRAPNPDSVCTISLYLATTPVLLQRLPYVADGYALEGAAGLPAWVAKPRGLATLVAGTKLVNNTHVTANSLIYLTVQTLGTVTVPKALYISARVPGVSFTITSADPTDTSTVAFKIEEPA